MIVQCPSCSTKYNLPDEKVKVGAKLRCSVCKNVFPLAGPADMEAPAEPAAPEPEPEAPSVKETPTEDEVFSSTYNEDEEIDFGDFGDLGIEGLDDLDESTVPDAAASGDEVDFGGFGEEEEPAPEFGPAEMDVEEDDEDSFEDIFGKKEVPEDLAVEFSDEEPGEEKPAPEEEEEGVPQARVAPGEDLFDIDAQEKKRAREAEKKEKKKKKNNRIVSIIFFTLLLLAAGGVIAYLYAPDLLKSIPFVGSEVETPETADPEQQEPDQPQPEEPATVADIQDLALKDIQQSYVENEKVGELFVVQGSVVNNFQRPKELIKVEASLFDQNGVPVVTKTQLIGNTLTLFQLQMLSMDEIDSELEDKVGIVTANTDVPQGGEVPFVVVFANPPQNVAEFGVKIVEAKDPPAEQAQ